MVNVHAVQLVLFFRQLRMRGAGVVNINILR